MATSEAPEWFTAALATEPTVATTLVDGVEIAYRSWGDGPLPGIVLVHGGAAHSRWWDHIAPLLAQAERRVVALDLSGHGDSGRRASYGLTRWSAEVIGVIEAVGFSQPPILVGHSMGGIIGMRLARTKGIHLDQVIVVDSPLVPSAARREADNASFSPDRRRSYASRDEAVARFRPVPAQESLPYVFRHIAENSVRELDGGWGWKFDPALFSPEVELPPDSERFLYPVTFFRAEFGLVPPSSRAELEARGGTFVELPQAGHAPMLDQPLVLVAAIRTAIALVSARS